MISAADLIYGLLQIPPEPTESGQHFVRQLLNHEALSSGNWFCGSCLLIHSKRSSSCVLTGFRLSRPSIPSRGKKIAGEIFSFKLRSFGNYHGEGKPSIVVLMPLAS